MSARKGIVSLFGMAVSFSALIGLMGCGREEIVFVSSTEFADATNIVFTERYGSDSNEWKHITVSDADELRRLVSFTQLRTKQYCACAHRHGALFQSSPGEVQVSFCNHCFDVDNGLNPGGYAMPKEFYAEFYRLVQRTTNGGWHVNPPLDRR